MKKLSKSYQKGISKKSWLTVGVLLLGVLIGTAGCGQSNTGSTSATTNQTQSSQTQSSQSQSTQGQSAQGKRVSNPAVRVAMDIIRLQHDQQNALTSDQKAKIKPLLQDLISASNPSQDVLQQKADAINAVLTDQQKTSLTQRRTPNGAGQNGTSQNANSTNGSQPKRNHSQNSNNGNQAKGTFNPQTLYQQALDAINN